MSVKKTYQFAGSLVAFGVVALGVGLSQVRPETQQKKSEQMNRKRVEKNYEKARENKATTPSL